MGSLRQAFLCTTQNGQPGNWDNVKESRSGWYGSGLKTGRLRFPSHFTTFQPQIAVIVSQQGLHRDQRTIKTTHPAPKQRSNHASNRVRATQHTKTQGKHHEITLKYHAQMGHTSLGCDLSPHLAQQVAYLSDRHPLALHLLGIVLAGSASLRADIDKLRECTNAGLKPAQRRVTWSWRQCFRQVDRRPVLSFAYHTDAISEHPLHFLG
jgi:hypothetical protein